MVPSAGGMLGYQPETDSQLGPSESEGCRVFRGSRRRNAASESHYTRCSLLEAFPSTFWYSEIDPPEQSTTPLRTVLSGVTDFTKSQQKG